MTLPELVELLNKLVSETPLMEYKPAKIFAASEYDTWRVVGAEVDDEGDVILELVEETEDEE